MNRSVFVSGLCVPCAFVLVGCGSKSSGSPYVGSEPPGDATTDGAVGAASDAMEESVGETPSDAASDAGVVCNTLADNAPTITTEAVASAPPTLTGGTIADGTYFLTALTEFTGDAGMAGAGGTNNTTIEVSGTTIQVSNGTNTTETVTTSGVMFTDMRTCPSAATRQGTYQATSTTLIVQFEQGTFDGGTNFIQETFTLQQ